MPKFYTVLLLSSDIHTCNSAWTIISFIPGIQICLLIVVLTLATALWLTTTRITYGVLSSGAKFVKLKEVDEPVMEYEEYNSSKQIIATLCYMRGVAL